MSDLVQFEENNSENRRPLGHAFENESSFLENLILKTGFVTEKKQAQYILLGIALALLVIAAFLLFGSGGKRGNAADKSPEMEYSNPETTRQSYI
jgi:hypothetical protein